MAADTRTQINVGTGGAQMDETSITQSDGATAAVRARVDVGYGADDERGRLVSKDQPLPVSLEAAILGEILVELREIKALMLQVAG